jgi:hypothetical protein
MVSFAFGFEKRGRQMTATIARRAFIAALGSAAAWPLAVHAQQGNRVRRIGVLMAGDENDPVPIRQTPHRLRNLPHAQSSLCGGRAHQIGLAVLTARSERPPRMGGPRSWAWTTVSR